MITEYDLAVAASIAAVAECTTYRLEGDLKANPTLHKLLIKSRDAARELGIGIHEARNILREAEERKAKRTKPCHPTPCTYPHCSNYKAPKRTR